MSTANQQIFNQQFRELHQDKIEQVISSGQTTTTQLEKKRASNTVDSSTRFDGKVATLKTEYPEVYKGILTYFQMYIVEDIKKRHERMMERIKKQRQDS
jgi:AICAR transformylase/IMP cyclohydrolase PurH